MTKDEIKYELRRSALADACPLSQCNGFAFYEARDIAGSPLSDMSADDLRTFYLLCAEAL